MRHEKDLQEPAVEPRLLRIFRVHCEQRDRKGKDRPMSGNEFFYLVSVGAGAILGVVAAILILVLALVH